MSLSASVATTGAPKSVPGAVFSATFLAASLLVIHRMTGSWSSANLGALLLTPSRLHRVFRLHHGSLAGALGVGVARRRPQVVADVALAHGIGRGVCIHASAPSMSVYEPFLLLDLAHCHLGLVTGLATVAVEVGQSRGEDNVRPQVAAPRKSPCQARPRR